MCKQPKKNTGQLSMEDRHQLLKKLEKDQIEKTDHEKLTQMLKYGGPALDTTREKPPRCHKGRKSEPDGEEPKKKKGHGRLGAKDYPGAEDEYVPHPKYTPITRGMRSSFIIAAPGMRVKTSQSS